MPLRGLTVQTRESENVWVIVKVLRFYRLCCFVVCVYRGGFLASFTIIRKLLLYFILNVFCQQCTPISLTNNNWVGNRSSRLFMVITRISTLLWIFYYNLLVNPKVYDYSKMYFEISDTPSSINFTQINKKRDIKVKLLLLIKIFFYENEKR